MKTPYIPMKRILRLVLAVFGLTLLGHQAFAQTTIAKWTFETLPSTLSYVPGAGVSTTNFPADIGTQAGIATATGKHFGGFGTVTYSSPVGNGSARSLSSNGWTNNPGDYYQFVVNTTSFTNIGISFDQYGSGTGPGKFYVSYSTDGVNFTQFGSIYTVLGAPTWNATTATTATSYSFDLSSITSLANAPTVYIRLVNANNTSVSGATVGSGGTSRVDNFTVLGTIAGPAQIVTQPSSVTNSFGDTATLSVVAGGDAPLSVQWYYPNLNTPLVDGGSGYGSGTISGSTSQTLTLTYVSTNQAGNYQVIVSNNSGSVTSVVAQLTVQVQTAIVTNIAYLHTLHNANYVLTDTTNLYTIEGIVTTPANLVSPDPASSFFVQDGTGGMDVFFRGGFPFPSAGDHVRVTAPLGQFNGLLEDSPINGNPAHSIEILDSGNPLPTPQLFDFTIPPTAIAMEQTNEGRYLVISNVFLAVTNADPHLVGNETIFMTNLTGQVFYMSVANNPLLGPIGNTLPGSFATSVTGVMSQSQTSGTVLTNGYSIVLADFSQIVIGTPPSNVVPIPLNIKVSGANVVLTWSDASFNLQSSTNVTGPYISIPAATGLTTYTDGISNQASFYRLQHP